LLEVDLNTWRGGLFGGAAQQSFSVDRKDQSRDGGQIRERRRVASLAVSVKLRSIKPSMEGPEFRAFLTLRRRMTQVPEEGEALTSAMAFRPSRPPPFTLFGIQG